MRSYQAPQLLAALALLFIIISGCRTPAERASDLTMEAYRVHWGKDWGEVIRLTTKAIAVDPDNPWPRSVRGAAYNATGRYDAALADLDAAIEMASDFTPAYTNRAMTHLMTGHLDSALRDIEEALVLEPENMQAIIIAAEVYSAIGDTVRACLYMESAVRRGFRDFGIVEEREGFHSLLYAPCYEVILRGVR